MRYNYYGVYCSSNSNPKFGYSSTQGKNLTDNYCGVYCWNNSYPVLGRSSPLNGGYNNFVNASQNIYNASSGVVYAHHIWWGSTNPALFKISGSGTTSYTDYLTSSVTISPAPPLSKQNEDIYASENNNIPMLTELDKAYELAVSNNLTEARKVCLDLINNYPDYSVSYNALNLLKETYTENELTDKKEMYKSLFNNKSKKDLYAMAGLILSDIDEENKLKQINEVINNYKGESVAELALFDKFVFYYFELDDKEDARAISKELDEQYPLSVGAVEVHRILGDKEYFKIEPKSNGMEKSDSEDILPMEYSLLGNYPNPFNPSTNISFTLPYHSSVDLIIYDILGRQIRSFLIQSQNPDHKELTWDGNDEFGEQVPSGVYLYRIKLKSLENAEEFVKTAKLIMLK